MSTRAVMQDADISRALTRISHEIIESNRGAGELVLLGIPTRGVPLAERKEDKSRNPNLFGQFFNCAQPLLDSLI